MELKSKPISFIVSHLLGNPIDETDTFIQLAKKQIVNGEYEKALKNLDEADRSVEESKSIIQDFRNGTYDT